MAITTHFLFAKISGSKNCNGVQHKKTRAYENPLAFSYENTKLFFVFYHQ